MNLRDRYAARGGIPSSARRPRSRRNVAGVALALVVTLLSACSGLPSSSPVQSGRGVDEKVLPEVRIVANPPAVGAGPEEIVRGFLRAGAAFQERGDDGQPVANSYLTSGSVSRWRPTTSVTVFDRATTVAVEQLTGDTMRARVGVVAVVDETGHYREMAPGVVAEVVLGLARVSGEWRIELPADGFGLWLNTDDFGRVMAPYRVHYPVLGGDHLVPDVRWFATGPRLVTALARAQLGAVPGYLAGAVETGFPADVTLAVDAVSVEAGVATVVLTPPASAVDVNHRRAIWAQLVATLSPAPNVQSVVVEVQGAGRLAVPDATGPMRSASDVGYRTGPQPLPRTALLRSGERVSVVELSRVDDIDGLASPRPTATSTAVPSGGTAGVAAAPASGGPPLPTVPAAYVGLAVSLDGTDLAAVAAGGAEIARWHEGQRVAVPAVATAFVRPAYDAVSRLWLAGEGASGAGIWTLDTRTTQVDPAPVAAAWLADRRMLSLAVSRDGSRVAVVTAPRAGGEARLDLAGVARDSTGRPVSLSEPLRQADPLTRMSDVVWIDDVTLAVLGAVGAEDPERPWIVQLGQGIGLRRIGIADPAINLIPVPAAARYLVSTGGPRGVVVVASPSAVLVRVGGAWRAVSGATELAVPPVS